MSKRIEVSEDVYNALQAIQKEQKHKTMSDTIVMLFRSGDLSGYLEGAMETRKRRQ